MCHYRYLYNTFHEYMCMHSHICHVYLCMYMNVVIYVYSHKETLEVHNLCVYVCTSILWSYSCCSSRMYMCIVSIVVLYMCVFVYIPCIHSTYSLCMYVQLYACMYVNFTRTYVLFYILFWWVYTRRIQLLCM